MKKNNSKQHFKIINKRTKDKTVNLPNKTKDYFVMNDLFIKRVTCLTALMISLRSVKLKSLLDMLRDETHIHSI